MITQTSLSSSDPSSFADFASDASIYAQFELQVAAHPHLPAVVTLSGTTTFEELDRIVRRIAAELVLLPHSEKPIALLMREGVLLFATILAASMANRIFIPLEITGARSWLARVVAASGAAFVVTDRSGQEDGLRIAGERPVLLAETLAETSRGPLLQSRSKSRDIAFIIYTSGSSGQPKGVAADHGFALHRVAARRKRYQFQAGARFGHARSCGYSAGLNTALAALLSGAGLNIFDLRGEGMHCLAPWLNARGITHLSLTSSFFRTWLATLPQDYRFPELRALSAAAEPLCGSDLARMATHLVGDWRLLHSLSSTETGVMTSAVFTPSSQVQQGVLPVGSPISGVEVRLEDEKGNLVSTGEAGEIVVHAEHMAHSYWNDPGATAAAFSTDSRGRRVYRTRDFGRWNEEGVLEHLGRKDRKIKLRGYSVEPHEVECALLRLPGIRDASVVVDGTGDGARILAFVSGPEDLSAAKGKEIRDELARDLPPQLVPAEVVALEALPLTPRGKVDRQALLQRRSAPMRAAARLPSNDIERMLFDIWQKTLHRKDFGIDDSFHDLGATSLHIFSVFSWLDALGWNLAPSMIFEAPTITQQAVRLRDYASPESTSRTVVTFRDTGEKPPLFFVHARKGDILYARELFPNLKGDRPYYGLKPPPLDGKSRIPRTIERIAASFIADIKKIQPEGPYHLCGYSFGGTVVYEMAQQLTAAGEGVAFLALVDTSTDPRERIGGRRVRRKRRPFQKIRKFFDPLWAVGVLVSYWQDEIRMQLRAPVMYERRLNFYNYIYMRASHRYRRRPYAGRMVVFSRLGQAKTHREQWTQLVLGGVDVHEIPGNHGEIVWPPVNALLAEALDKSLAAANPD